MISALLLAAGAARRFGSPKLTQEVHGRPVVRWSADLLRRAPVDDVLVVVAPEHADIRDALTDVEVKFVVNDQADRGIGSSIACGVRALDPRTSAVLIALADEPMLSVDAVRSVVACYERERRGGGTGAAGALIVAPRHAGTPGHPVLFDRAVFAELLALDGDAGARDVIRRDPARVAVVELGAPPPLDVDTPADLANLRVQPPRRALLDELMPRFDVSASYSAAVAAPTSVVYRAVLETNLAESLVSRVLMAIRSLGRRAPGVFRFGDLPEHGAFFALASDPPREIVAGVIGRFWGLAGAVVDAGRSEFLAPLPAGMAKAAWSFRVDDRAAGAQLSTETRVLCADDDARRRFLRYWTVIGPFSGIVRREALRLIRARAQFTAPSTAR